MERTNARYLESLPEPVDLVTIDASFISLKLLLPSVVKWLNSPAAVVALVKPQFEAGREQVGRGGVIRDRRVHRQVLQQVITYGVDAGLDLRGLAPSPITGPAGNHEFLLHLGWQTPPANLEMSVIIQACLGMLSPT
jgi:23S rRNA (cytidine1920-2'-O)/16S rRNA (cytidine1409-2'-O)-methyltransferase